MTIFVQPDSLTKPTHTHTHTAADRVLQQTKVINYKTIAEVAIRPHRTDLVYSLANLKIIILWPVIGLGIFIHKPVKRKQSWRLVCRENRG